MYINFLGENLIHKNIVPNEFLEVILCGITNPNPTYRIIHNLSRIYVYDYYIFEYVMDGCGYIETNDGVHKVSDGDLYFLNKLSRHIVYSDPQTPFKKVFLVLDGSFVDSLVNTFHITEDLIVRHVDAQQVMDKILSLCDCETITQYDEISVEVLKLFEMLGKHSYKPQSSNGIAHVIKSFLDGNLEQKVTIQMISESLHISKSHIERTFKNTYGETPLGYFFRNKINYACALLINTDYSVAEIAEMLSFTDAKYFSKCIKTETGLSPLAYRKTKKPPQR